MKVSFLSSLVCAVMYILAFYLLSPFFSHESDREFLAMFTLPIGIFFFFYMMQKNKYLYAGQLLLFFSTIWASTISISACASLLDGSSRLGDIAHGSVLIFFIVFAILNICAAVLRFSQKKKYHKTAFLLVNFYSVALISICIFVGWMIVGVGGGLGGAAVLIFPLVSGVAVILAILLTVAAKIKFSGDRLFANNDY